MNIKQRIDDAVGNQIRNFLDRYDKEEIKPIPEDQKVDVVRMTFRTKEEFEIIKTSLESQGYQLTCEEFYEQDVDDKNYSATILGERRVQMTEEELRPRDVEKERKKEKIVHIGVKAMWWAIFYSYYGFGSLLSTAPLSRLSKKPSIFIFSF
jgi:hypothetical protein